MLLNIHISDNFSLQNSAYEATKLSVLAPTQQVDRDDSLHNI
jgi:hypothetical protein